MTDAPSELPSAPAEPPQARRRSREKNQAIALKSWVVLARAYLAIAGDVDADVARFGLTSSEFGILEALHHKGPLLLGDLQRKLLVTSGGMTYLVDRLVAKGLVTRQSFPGDKRARFAVLTTEGSDLIRQIFPAHAKRLARVLDSLSPKEQKRVTALLRTLGKGAERRPLRREPKAGEARLSQ